jgi:hypothetical protein
MAKTKKSYCLRCNFKTNHNILSKHSIRSDNEDYDYAIDYMIVECLGCERVSFREEFVDIESAYPNEHGEWIPDIIVDTYPKKSRALRKLENIHILPKKIKVAYDEAIKAFNADCFILTGVAFRAIIEGICIEEEIPGRNLEKKINALVRNKLITEKESKRLHSIRFIGNDSVHEMKVPREESLRIVLNIIEHLLNNLYLIDYNSKHHLETVIDKFPEFTELLSYTLPKFKANEEIPLAKILGKNVRRLNGRISDFETELITKINQNEYDKLDVGKVDTYGDSTSQVQHFIIK